jgi:hypothetical protein
MPARQVVIIGVLLRLLDVTKQLLFVVVVDELAGLLPLIGNQPRIPPLLG